MAPQNQVDEKALYRAMFRWTFFDPANLLSIGCLATAAVLTVLTFRSRAVGGAYMSMGFYLCIFAFLRGYFFAYYHCRRFWRGLVWLILSVSLIASGILWEDRAGAFELLTRAGVQKVKPASSMHVAAILHAVVAGVLTVHLWLPRRWLIRQREEQTGEAPMQVEE